MDFKINNYFVEKIFEEIYGNIICFFVVSTKTVISCNLKHMIIKLI